MQNQIKTNLDEKELAQRWNLSVKTLQGKRQRGEPPRFFKIGRAVRYQLTDIIALEQENIRSSTSQTSVGDSLQNHQA